MIDLQSYFDAFDAEISIGYPQTGRIDSAIEAISGFLQSRYDLPAANFFCQGSYPNGTAVEPPADGEYDVDIVAYCVPPGTSGDDALDTLEGYFLADGRYKERVVRKDPCVRLEYAADEVGKFHVDVVPVRSTGKAHPPYEAPRRGSGWHETAPREYTDWCRDQGDRYTRTVKALKRWRDTQQNVRHAIKSIVLQVIVAECMPSDVESDADRLAQTIIRLHDSLAPLNEAPEVLNPVLRSENLAKRWKSESFRNFVKELAEAREFAVAATSTDNVLEAADAWREILGEDFPMPGAASLGIRVGDASHRHGIAGQGWVLALDPRYHVSITAARQRGKRSQNRQRYESDGSPIFAGYKINFSAHVRAPRHCEIWWQVANTGGHARQVDGLRGEFLRAKSINDGVSADQASHWEGTAYTGAHLVRALLVREGRVVAVSDDFIVNIFKRGWAFKP